MKAEPRKGGDRSSSSATTGPKGLFRLPCVFDGRGRAAAGLAAVARQGLAGIRGCTQLVAAHAEVPGEAVIGIRDRPRSVGGGVGRGRLSGACGQPVGGGPTTATAITSRAPNPDPQFRCQTAAPIWYAPDRHNDRPIAGDSAEAGADQGSRPAHQVSILDAHRTHQSAAQRVARASNPVALVAFDYLARRRRPGALGGFRPPSRARHCSP